MFLELLNNAVIDSSLFYFYFGILLVSFGFMYLINHHNVDSFVSGYFWENKHQNIKVNLSQLKKPFIINEPFIVWLIITFKRIDEKDDKEENIASYFNNEFKIRGGQIWKETSCSRPFINIV
ncbi:hypothetical protein M3210_08465 [Oceanobacillus luteolus]|uniref:hypothetical protein n=1 Tax=Oceanobacillus luteolus TaxID=1274358 RepID=UPI00203F54CD|nr:hypothetical protein [Oceanobacillus luteolus]MCM3740302.1 hypothetical protein [Oceanobacillus luteolus]